MAESFLHHNPKTDLWETPQAFFDALHREFQFTLDTCAISSNAKCANFISPEQDGLTQDWNGVAWCNPPYGRCVGKWLEKAYLASQAGATVVCLVFARTGTRWFHDWVLGKAEVRFVRGRLKFGDAKLCAPHDSLVIIYRPS